MKKSFSRLSRWRSLSKEVLICRNLRVEGSEPREEGGQMCSTSRRINRDKVGHARCVLGTQKAVLHELFPILNVFPV